MILLYFFIFFELGLRKCPTFAKRSISDVWQCSEYTVGSEYTRFLSMLLVLNMLGFWIYLSRNIGKTFSKKIWEYSISWKLENVFLKKYKKLFQSRFFQGFFRERLWGLRPKTSPGSFIYYYLHPINKLDTTNK